MKAFKEARLILGDQLNINHSWFSAAPKGEVVYLIIESKEEASYVRHHIQKVVGFFLAMRWFHATLIERGFDVMYVGLSHKDNKATIIETILHLKEVLGFSTFSYQEPDEYRIDLLLSSLGETQGLTVWRQSSEHFFTERSDLAGFFKGRKTYLMESFYRMMRKKHNILMELPDKPIGGDWNFDAENRKPYDGKAPFIPIPTLPKHSDEIESIINQLNDFGISTMGSIDVESFNHATSRDEAITLLDHFCQYLIPYFGTYEDAMVNNEMYLFHSRLSFALNIKLVSPREVTEAAISAWQQSKDMISLAQIEGFVRQILGWREFMRGVYWAQMPDFANLNYFKHHRQLPSWFWTGETKMNCLSKCISQSLDHAYAHHIQRLMVIGNFALLYGAHPDEVDAWYLGVYIDALEWVEITNTRGMSQFADGGIVGTKPYVSSANYISKMSNYCVSCYYDKSKRHGEKACPFNSLYWHFFARHEALLGKNPRIGMVYPSLKKMAPSELEATLRQADIYIDHINEL